MNLDQFFAHWRITENPFRGEEARHDAVFARMAGLNGQPASTTNLAGGDNLAGKGVAATHADFEKIVGSLEQLSTAVVFGEKGSGKTAIRLQITRQVIAHNAANPGRKIFLIAYDDLTPEPIELPPRQDESGYVRPPVADQTFVPETY